MPTTEAQRIRSRRALTIAIIALVVSLAANAAVGVSLIVTRAQTQNYADCTAQWQQQFSVAYLARSDSANEVSTALDMIVLAVSEQDRAKMELAVKNYLRIRDNQQESRAKNPLPPLPQTLCGLPSGGQQP